MVLKSIRSILTVSFVLILFTVLIPMGNVQALSSHLSTDSLPLLDRFVGQGKNGEMDDLRSIYIPGILVAPILQQPRGQGEFVSPRQNVVTQFGLASKFGSAGLLAHNYLAGESFAHLEKGQKFYLVHKDGQTSAFMVTEIWRYQALEPANTSSDFMNLGDGAILTASELFLKVYNRPGQVILQTCISVDEDLSWGRLFVIAEPYFPEP